MIVQWNICCSLSEYNGDNRDKFKQHWDLQSESNIWSLMRNVGMYSQNRGVQQTKHDLFDMAEEKRSC